MKPLAAAVLALFSGFAALAPVLAQAQAQAQAQTQAQGAPFCVRNDTAQTYFFTVAGRASSGGENGGENRLGRTLAPGEDLCIPKGGMGAGMGGTVSVFLNQDAVEGCSRLVGAGVSEALLAYSEFDRCRWSSNDG